MWNPAVANLTLLALGSSAPEIMMSCIEIMSSEVCVCWGGGGWVGGPRSHRRTDGGGLHICIMYNVYIYFYLRSV